jgi:hypothetical protein
VKKTLSKFAFQVHNLQRYGAGMAALPADATPLMKAAYAVGGGG